MGVTKIFESKILVPIDTKTKNRFMRLVGKKRMSEVIRGLIKTYIDELENKNDHEGEG